MHRATSLQLTIQYSPPSHPLLSTPPPPPPLTICVISNPHNKQYSPQPQTDTIIMLYCAFASITFTFFPHGSCVSHVSCSHIIYILSRILLICHNHVQNVKVSCYAAAKMSSNPFHNILSTSWNNGPTTVDHVAHVIR